jgi:hypothetical protein
VTLIQFILDKLLVTYYYKERVEHNDLLNRAVLKVMKYGAFVFLCFASTAIADNYCTMTNTTVPVYYTNEQIKCKSWWFIPDLLFWSSIAILVILVIVDSLCKDKREQSKFIKKVANEEENYFGRLSNIDRKCWIAEEHYRRKHLGVKTLSDSAFESLCITPGRKYKQQNDPHCYEILANSVYSNKF